MYENTLDYFFDKRGSEAKISKQSTQSQVLFICVTEYIIN